jgi:hypothetical protein
MPYARDMAHALAIRQMRLIALMSASQTRLDVQIHSSSFAQPLGSDKGKVHELNSNQTSGPRYW